MDIQLSDGNSFDFITAARPVSVIIFITAYDPIRAFTINSIGYSGGDKYCPLEVADIAYLYSENKITFAGQEHVVDLSLNKLVEQLNSDQFFRANRQILLCVKAITHIEPYFNGKIVVFVKPAYKSQITISGEKITAFKLWLNF